MKRDLDQTQAIFDKIPAYSEELQDYFCLRLQSSLSDRDEKRMEQILTKAIHSSLLSLLLDELDHLILHRDNALDIKAIERMQKNLTQMVKNYGLEPLKTPNIAQTLPIEDVRQQLESLIKPL